MSEKLVYAMSTRGSLKLSQFYEIFRVVYLPTGMETDESVEVDLRRQIVRVLDSLGYCEFDFNNSMVYMCKPSLVLLPVYGSPKALLVGARTPALVKKLKAAVKKQSGKALFYYHVQSHTNINIPAAIHIEAVDTSALNGIASEMGIEYYGKAPAAWGLANFSASIPEIKNNAHFEKRSEPNWKRRIFMPNYLYFANREKASEGSLMLAEYRNPVNQQLQHWLWDGPRAAVVERDWGRYLVLSSVGSKVLLYNERLYQLAVPITVPLPCILARAVALCIGMPPVRVTSSSRKIASVPSGHPLQVYQGVTPAIAFLVASKLGQKLVTCSFEIDKKRMLHA